MRVQKGHVEKFGCGTEVTITHLIPGGGVAEIVIKPQFPGVSEVLHQDYSTGKVSIMFWRKYIPQMIELLKAMLPEQE